MTKKEEDMFSRKSLLVLVFGVVVCMNVFFSKEKKMDFKDLYTPSAPIIPFLEMGIASPLLGGDVGVWVPEVGIFSLDVSAGYRYSPLVIEGKEMVWFGTSGWCGEVLVGWIFAKAFETNDVWIKTRQLQLGNTLYEWGYFTPGPIYTRHSLVGGVEILPSGSYTREELPVETAFPDPMVKYISAEKLFVKFGYQYETWYHFLENASSSEPREHASYGMIRLSTLMTTDFSQVGFLFETRSRAFQGGSLNITSSIGVIQRLESAKGIFDFFSLYFPVEISFGWYF